MLGASWGRHPDPWITLILTGNSALPVLLLVRKTPLLLVVYPQVRVQSVHREPLDSR
jgi:hypothetical protein